LLAAYQCCSHINVASKFPHTVQRGRAQSASVSRRAPFQWRWQAHILLITIHSSLNMSSGVASPREILFQRTLELCLLSVCLFPCCQSGLRLLPHCSHPLAIAATISMGVCHSINNQVATVDVEPGCNLTHDVKDEWPVRD
jgi:hypothetical protein